MQYEMFVACSFRPKAFGAAALNPSSIIALLGDGKQVFEDVDALYELAGKMEAIVAQVATLRQFLTALLGCVSQCRTFVSSYERLRHEL